MISQKHKDEMQQGEHISTPVEEKLTTTASKRRSQQAPSSPRRWISVLLCILGIAMPLIAGSMLWWPWGVPDFLDADWVFNTVILSGVVSVVVGVVLLYFAFHAWWVIVFAPVAWMVGEFLGAVVRPLGEGGWSALVAQEHFWDFQSVIIPLAIMLLFVCTLLGAAAVFGIHGLSFWWENRKYRW